MPVVCLYYNAAGSFLGTQTVPSTPQAGLFILTAPAALLCAHGVIRAQPSQACRRPR